MNCQEVVEWMHRYIDHDLSEEETAQMFEHFRHCKDCTALFSRLNRLSTELEQLSDVTPRYSLVDAILPQLDAIDKARQEEASTAGLPEAVRPYSELDRSHVNKRTTSWRSRINGRAIAGVVAAAIVLGVFINNYEPKTLSNAEMEVVPTTEQLKTLDQSAADRSEITAQVNVPMAKEAQKESLDEPTSNQENSPNKSDSSVSGSVPSKVEDSKSSAQHQSHDSSRQSSKSADSSSIDSVDQEHVKPAASLGANGNAGTTTQDQNKSTAPASDASASDQPVQSSNKQSQPILENKGTDPKSSNDQSKLEPKTEQPSDKIYGIAAFNPQSWLSPDGKFTAVIEEGQLNFYSISANADNTKSKNLIASNTILGDWVQGSWSEDSTVFTYETKQEDKVTQYTYQIPSNPQ
ncbi:zf-HC2 domain-containing protein [Paenibacillus sediminis]|uniref:Anti-sigma-W factor RsiW n=1 Tax=Paenibacillus sediminis TaxID=664909 RepID=A0ABS4GYM4_9BACL|nr:zf-HC2 domain-containing protein [Paenibacillus sediminis]MBP1935364.1 anti-sigma factor RsiW [Paenibacillus sediminis]